MTHSTVAGNSMGYFITDYKENNSSPDDLLKLIEQLPPDQMEVLKLRYFKDMSFKKISDITGVSINTALGRMRYALINLRKLAQEQHIDLQLK